MHVCLWRKWMLAIVIIFNGAICYASEEILLTRYGYGFLIWDGIKHDKPAIWPYSYPSDATRINDMIYPRFAISDEVNKNTQKKYKFYVSLEIEKRDKYLQAHVVFQNKSTAPYYVHKSGLAEPKKNYFYPVCSDAFSITTGGILLNFLAMRCRYDIEDEWKEVPAGSTFAFSSNLNEAYAFPSGYRRYNIGSVEYDVVTENWFQEQSINEAMFSILDWEYHCKIKKNVSYIASGRAVCDREKKSFSAFIHHSGLKSEISEISENEFYIRTNQVTLYVDGDTLQPFNYNRY